MKAIAAAIFMLISGLVLPAFAKESKDIQRQVTFPKISIPEPAYNFGTVPEGEKVVHTKRKK